MVIPVVWISLNPDAIARGYWDEALLEDLLAGDGWAPPGGLTFEHHEARCPDDAEMARLHDLSGGVLVVPARHHADAALVARLRDLAESWEWGLVLLMGDEEGAFPGDAFAGLPHIEAWPQTPAPGRQHQSPWLPNGYPPGLRPFLRAWSRLDRRWEWSFAGQITHARREAAATVMRQLAGGHLVETDGFTRGAAQEDYWGWLAQTRVAPCPAGPCHVDTFRTWEALEAGAVPIVDASTGAGDNMHGYWTQMEPPFPIVHDWDEMPGLIRQIVRRWPIDANAAGAWWLARKREMAWNLTDTIRRLAGRPASGSSPDELITVLMPTSPTPSHPSTAHLEETLASVRERLPTAEIILVCDPPRPELSHRLDAWNEYVQRVVRMANLEWTNVLPVVLTEWHHQALAIRSVMQQVRTPLLLFVEHDTPLVGDLPLPDLVPPLLSGEANVIRLYHEVKVHPDHRHLMLDDEPTLLTGYGNTQPVPLLRTAQWSQRPHLARVDFYNERVLARFTRKSRTMIEDAIHGVVHSAYTDRGEAAWWNWRLWLYHPDTPIPEGGVKRSTHLDSRGADPKLPMVYALREPGQPLS